MKTVKHKREMAMPGWQDFFNDERGGFGLKEIIFTVAIIVVVGAVVAWLAGGDGMQTMIEQVWGALGEWLDSEFGFGWS